MVFLFHNWWWVLGRGRRKISFAFFQKVYSLSEGLPSAASGLKNCDFEYFLWKSEEGKVETQTSSEGDLKNPVSSLRENMTKNYFTTTQGASALQWYKSLIPLIFKLKSWALDVKDSFLLLCESKSCNNFTSRLKWGREKHSRSDWDRKLWRLFGYCLSRRKSHYLTFLKKLF